jgi:multidrug efflux pump subunit AcrB
MGGNSVDVEIMGHDFNTTTNLAHTIAEQARKIPGAEDIKISRDEDKSELQIVLDQDKLARHGLSTADVGSYLRNRIYGYRNSKFKEDGEEYDIIVRLDEKYRSSITDVENILITDGKGQKVRLKELGEIKEYFSPPNIERKSKQRILKVSITPVLDAGIHRDGSTVRVIQDAVYHHVGYPVRIHRCNFGIIAHEHDIKYCCRLRSCHAGWYRYEERYRANRLYQPDA